MFYFATNDYVAFKIVEDKQFHDSQNGILLVLGEAQGKMFISANEFAELCDVCEQSSMQTRLDYYAITNLLTGKEEKIVVKKGIIQLRKSLLHLTEITQLSNQLGSMTSFCFDTSRNILVGLDAEVEIHFKKERINVSSSDKRITDQIFDFYVRYLKVLDTLSREGAMKYLDITQL